jgi:hypothetical protein
MRVMFSVVACHRSIPRIKPGGALEAVPFTELPPRAFHARPIRG